MKEMVGGCCVCSDERGWPDNPLVYCDGNGCTVAVHQACYGIVTVPTGPWYCRKCESPENKGKVKCELCPSKSGALKRTDTGGWAHVVCALYIPEVRFGNVTSMEPIVLRLIPPERYNKTCYICQDLSKSHRAAAGACMQCNKSGCKQQFHVTCAQSLGLLCEEAGNYLDNVKYCGYCQHHYSKLKKGGNVKTIPPYKPVAHDSHSSDSCGEKEGGVSPLTANGAPQNPAKLKSGNRKSSHSAGASSSGKSTPVSTKPNPSVPVMLDKKKSPSRRSSTASESAAAGKTPSPSPQHSQENQGAKTPGRSTPGRRTPAPSESPGAGKHEPGGVISAAPPASVPALAPVPPATPAPPASTAVTTSVVQTPQTKTSTHQESVITNIESAETKQTKKRKAVTAANASAPLDYALQQGGNEQNGQSSSGAAASTIWEPTRPNSDVPMENSDKVIKKAKTESGESANKSILPPPPAHSPVPSPVPRHIPSPMPGPSGINNMRSPSQSQMSTDKNDRYKCLIGILCGPLKK